MKKGAYDLGRKSLYYLVVLIIVAILFGYMNNRFSEYQTDRLSNLNEVTDIVMIKNIMKCVSQKDPDTGNIDFFSIDTSMLEKDNLMSCLGKSDIYTDKAIKLKVGGLEVVTQDPFFEYSEYERTVILPRIKSPQTLEISIEKYPEIK